MKQTYDKQEAAGKDETEPCLINTARAALVDTLGMKDALKRKESRQLSTYLTRNPCRKIRRCTRWRASSNTPSCRGQWGRIVYQSEKLLPGSDSLSGDSCPQHCKPGKFFDTDCFRSRGGLPCTDVCCRLPKIQKRPWIIKWIDR